MPPRRSYSSKYSLGGSKYNYRRRRRMVFKQRDRTQQLRANVSRSIISKRVAPHLFKRMTQNVFSETAGNTISGVSNTMGTAFTQFNIQFRLSDLPNSAEITALYDQFMITKIILKFIPYRNIAELTNAAASGGLGGGRLITVIDNDDSTNITADSAREYSTAKITNYGRTHIRVLTPAILRQMYESSISTAYTPAFKQWISTTDPTAIHYGVKGGLIVNDSAAVTASIQYSIEATYYFKCKNTK